jgi:hypothetical protein
MHDDAPQNGERPFPPGDMVTASELREFLFCERAWFLNRQGFRVSAQAESNSSAPEKLHQKKV